MFSWIRTESPGMIVLTKLRSVDTAVAAAPAMVPDGRYSMS